MGCASFNQGSFCSGPFCPCFLLSLVVPPFLSLFQCLSFFFSRESQQRGRGSPLAGSFPKYLPQQGAKTVYRNFKEMVATRLLELLPLPSGVYLVTAAFWGLRKQKTESGAWTSKSNLGIPTWALSVLTTSQANMWLPSFIFNYYSCYVSVFIYLHTHV